jgi:hypothetical protein
MHTPPFSPSFVVFTELLATAAPAGAARSPAAARIGIQNLRETYFARMAAADARDVLAALLSAVAGMAPHQQRIMLQVAGLVSRVEPSPAAPPPWLPQLLAEAEAAVGGGAAAASSSSGPGVGKTAGDSVRATTTASLPSDAALRADVSPVQMRGDAAGLASPPRAGDPPPAGSVEVVLQITSSYGPGSMVGLTEVRGARIVGWVEVVQGLGTAGWLAARGFVGR